ncbi:MAG: trypsin-like peptidase domain-containing protein [Patescibacteria group bacterium]|nr:trypsin-like peptidase domain-containing protein [Patescibacteria group bacterium]
MEEVKKQPQKIVSSVLLISFLVGGITGGLVGAITGATVSDSLGPWLKKTFLNQSNSEAPSDANNNSDSLKSTVTVEEESETIDTVTKVTPAVGSIIVKQDLSKLYSLSNPSPFDIFFGQQTDQAQGVQQVAAGTGFIVSSDGLILTNKHVINVSQAEYTFITNEGKQYDATLVDVDPFNDIAFMRIEAKDLPYVDLGDSDSLKIGQTVIAIGNTLSEYPNTVTKGIVSGIGRTITAGTGGSQTETIEEVIQTDAAINPGNSGGPLINLSGQVVGINTAVSQEGQLIGFAIPMNVVKPVLESVEQTGKVVRPYLGIRYQIINSEISQANSLSVDYGALIIRGANNELAIVPGSPADKAGLEENDIVLEINGQKIDEDNTLSKMMKRFKVGDEVSLKVLHDGQTKEITIQLEKYTASTE